MEFPKILPAGTLIRIGQRELPHAQVKHSAIGVVFQTDRDLPLIKDGKFYYYRIRRTEVIEAPNGWPAKTISHSINLAFDEVIDGIKNKILKKQLTLFKEED